MAKRTPRSGTTRPGDPAADKPAGGPARPRAPRRRAAPSDRSARADAGGGQNAAPDTFAARAVTQAGRTHDTSDVESRSMASEPSDEDIRMRAYHLYLERGGGHGMDFEDWLRAERELRDNDREH